MEDTYIMDNQTAMMLIGALSCMVSFMFGAAYGAGRVVTKLNEQIEKQQQDLQQRQKVKDLYPDNRK